MHVGDGVVVIQHLNSCVEVIDSAWPIHSRYRGPSRNGVECLELDAYAALDWWVHAENSVPVEIEHGGITSRVTEGDCYKVRAITWSDIVVEHRKGCKQDGTAA